MARFLGAEEINRLLDVNQRLVVVAVLAQVFPVVHRGHCESQWVARSLGVGQGAEHYVLVLNHEPLLRLEAGLNGQQTERFRLPDSIVNVAERSFPRGRISKETR